MLAFGFIHAWLALAAAPVAVAAVGVHLLNRARRRPVRWAAMQFLEAAILQSRRRLRLERWLLIALRTIMLTLLALFVARPIVRGLRVFAAGDTGGALLVVVDNGLAMQAPAGQPSRSLLADAVDAVLPLVHTWKGPVAILPALGDQGIQWFRRQELAEAALAKVPATAGRADWIHLLPRITGIVSESSLPSDRRSVLIVSSLTQGNWPASQLLHQPLSQLKGAAGHVMLLDMQPALRDNLSVTELSVESAFAGRDLPACAAATIANHSQAAASDLKVVWSVDGREVRQDDLPDIPPGAQRSLAADLPALSAGEHNVSVRLAATDVLPADDQRWASVRVPQRYRVVLVEPDLAATPASRASLFVAAVLSSAVEQSTVPLQVDVVDPAGLEAALIEPADAVLLCDAVLPAAADWQALKGHVDRGCGLITWLGPRSAAAPGAVGGLPVVADLLPARLLGVQAASSGGNWPVYLATPVRTAFLDLAEGVSNAVGFLGNAHDLVDVAPAPAARLLARSEAGQPVVLLRQVGRGRSIFVGTSPDLSWADLAGRPTFPAFVLGLLREAVARSADGTQVNAGEPIRLVMPGGGSIQQARWIKPDGSSEPARISLDDGVSAAVLPVAAMPGAYQLEAGGASRTAYANADAQAGDLREIGETGRSGLVDAGLVLLGRGDVSGVIAAGGADEDTHWLAYFVVALALLEVVLTAVFARART